MKAFCSSVPKVSRRIVTARHRLYTHIYIEVCYAVKLLANTFTTFFSHFYLPERRNDVSEFTQLDNKNKKNRYILQNLT